MRKITGQLLWVGNPSDTLNVRSIIDAGIEAVVEVADNEPFALLPREIVRCRFPLSDGGDNPAWLLRLAADTVAAFVRARIPAIVCCSGGMNRSVCIAAAGLTVASGMELDASLVAVIGNGPADVSPRFLAQLREVIAGPFSQTEET